MKYAADNSKNIFTPTPLKRIGLGTVVQTVLKPIAKVVGRSGCSSCRRRARKLNRMVPNVNPFAK